MATKTVQSTFATPEEKVRGVLDRAARQERDRTIVTVSGGTDSVLAAHLAATIGPEFGIDPDAVLHANTGLAVPQTQLVAQIIASAHDLPYIEANNGTTGPRALVHGWPMEGKMGHFFERIERKQDVFDALHANFSGELLCISGARANESDERKMNVPDSGVAEDNRNDRMTWASPLVGVTSGEKAEWITKAGLPVSEAYEILGFSAECVGCSYDGPKLLDSLNIIAPELAYAMRLLTAWMPWEGWRDEDDPEMATKKLRWGWTPGEDLEDLHGQQALNGEEAEPNAPIGCSAEDCKDAEIPEWVRRLPSEQIVDREDVLAWWNGDAPAVVDRFRTNMETIA